MLLELAVDTSNDDEEEEDMDFCDVDDFNDDDAQMDSDVDVEDEIISENDDEMEDADAFAQNRTTNGADDQSWDMVNDDISDNWTIGIDDNINDIGEEQEKIVSIIRKCRKLIFMIKYSATMMSFVRIEKEKLNISKHLCRDVKSRWNSTYAMIDSLINLREVIQKLFNSKHSLGLETKKLRKLSALEITIDDWIMLSVLHSVLQPFNNATKALSGQQYSSIGMAYYLTHGLKHYLQKSDRNENQLMKKLKHLLLCKYQHYFEKDTTQIQLLKVGNTCFLEYK